MSKEFDTAKGAFYLVAIIIITQMVAAMIVIAGCTFGMIFEGPIKACENIRDPILELFQMSFTAAIAFAGGRMSAPGYDPPKLPPEKKE